MDSESLGLIGHDLTWVLLRRDFGRPADYPVPISGPDGRVSTVWIGTDRDCSRLVNRAKVESFDKDRYLSDFSLGVLLSGSLIDLGPLPDQPGQEPETRVCEVCGYGYDKRLFFSGWRENSDGSQAPTFSTRCPFCLASGMRIRRIPSQLGNEKRRELIEQLLHDQPFRSNVAISELVKRQGISCSGSTVGRVRRQMEAQGKLRPFAMRAGTDNRVWRCDYQALRGNEAE
jgi:hypothetical protein